MESKELIPHSLETNIFLTILNLYLRVPCSFITALKSDYVNIYIASPPSTPRTSAVAIGSAPPFSLPPPACKFNIHITARNGGQLEEAKTSHGSCTGFQTTQIPGQAAIPNQNDSHQYRVPQWRAQRIALHACARN